MKHLHRSDMLYSEQDIIRLHALFLTTGIHHIKVHSVEHGRILIDTLVTTLHYYQSLACITLEKGALSASTYNYAIDLAQQESIESFFAEQFFADFIWVELTDSLLRKSWYKKTENHIYSSPLHLQLPIIFFCYKSL